MSATKSKLSRSPQTISERDWYYEEPNNLLLVHEVRDVKTDAYICTEQIKIPWSMIRKSVGRIFQ